MEFAHPEWGRVAMITTDYNKAGKKPTPTDIHEELIVEDVIKQKWERDQEKLKKQVFLEDVDDWSRHRLTPDMSEQYPFKKPLQYVGGVDISFVKGDNVNACAAFVVLNYPELEVVYEDLSMVKLTAPYIPGFLAFREGDFLVEKIRKLKQKSPELMPQVILVDGNGILHPRGFGLACHLGVLTDLATVGAAKNLFFIDGMEKDDIFKNKIKNLTKAGDSFPLIGQSGMQHGVAYRGCEGSTNPIFISPGHKLTMDTALWVTEKCIKFRVPEPTRQADLRSREYLRLNWEVEESKHKKKQKSKKKPAQSESNSDHKKEQLKTSDNEEVDVHMGLLFD